MPPASASATCRLPRTNCCRTPLDRRAARKASAEASDLGDLDTAGLSTDVSRGIDKWLWFAEAHLQAER
jgi:DNA-binding ferritin-like protein